MGEEYLGALAVSASVRGHNRANKTMARPGQVRLVGANQLDSDFGRLLESGRVRFS